MELLMFLAMYGLPSTAVTAGFVKLMKSRGLMTDTRVAAAEAAERAEGAERAAALAEDGRQQALGFAQRATHDLREALTVAKGVEGVSQDVQELREFLEAAREEDLHAVAAELAKSGGRLGSAESGADLGAVSAQVQRLREFMADLSEQRARELTGQLRDVLRAAQGAGDVSRDVRGLEKEIRWLRYQLTGDIGTAGTSAAAAEPVGRHRKHDDGEGSEAAAVPGADGGRGPGSGPGPDGGTEERWLA